MKRWSVLLVLAMFLGSAATGADESKVNYVPASKLLADVRKAPPEGPGISVVHYLNDPRYAAMVARRTRPGGSEVHRTQMDIWYVVEGGGTLVTGGSLVEPQEIEPNELRGSGITGGNARRIAKGDFVTIPPGVAHWIKSINGNEIIYLVVKVMPDNQ